MIRCCEGRIAKDESLTFGDGKTKFYAEARCPAQILVLADEQALCKECRIEGHGTITDPFPASSRIFGPTAWFLASWKRCGAPSRDSLKKAIKAHTIVANSAMRTKRSVTATPAAAAATTTAAAAPTPTPNKILYYQTDETIQLTAIKESHKLKPIKVKTKTYYKDPITGLLFDRTTTGNFLPHLST